MGNETPRPSGDGQTETLGNGNGNAAIPGDPFVIGLIGGIGSGKSKVAAAFASRGARVISGDDLAHQALRQPDIKARIADRWGRGVFDEHSEVQRSKLAAIVFGDPAERRVLEEIMHPWIRHRIRHEVDNARNDPGVRLVVLDAAIMLETGWNEICDRLVFIDAPKEERLRRVAGQRGWSANDLEARERAQLPLTAKAARADHALDNSSSLDRLGCQVDELLRLWGRTADSCPAPTSVPGSGSAG
jgi:dephospho-CoA kinase